MCGINGFFSVPAIKKNEERILSMNKAIHHRGC